MVLDLDLNDPPLIDGISVTVSPNLNVDLELSHIQVTTDLEPIDDEVVICSPRSFAEARANARRNRGVIEVLDEESEFQTGRSESTGWLCPRAGRHHRVPPLQRTGIYGLSLQLEDDEITKDLLSLHQLPSENDINSPELVPQTVSIPSQTPNISCPVCMCSFLEETATKCGHIFCKRCIDTAIAVQKKCPTCRRNLKPKDTVRIYLPASE